MSAYVTCKVRLYGGWEHRIYQGPDGVEVRAMRHYNAPRGELKCGWTVRGPGNSTAEPYGLASMQHAVAELFGVDFQSVEGASEPVTDVHVYATSKPVEHLVYTAPGRMPVRIEELDHGYRYASPNVMRAHIADFLDRTAQDVEEAEQFAVESGIDMPYWHRAACRSVQDPAMRKRLTWGSWYPVASDTQAVHRAREVYLDGAADAFCTVVDCGSNTSEYWEIVPAVRSGDDYMDAHNWDDAMRTVYTFAHAASDAAAAATGGAA